MILNFVSKRKIKSRYAAPGVLIYCRYYERVKSHILFININSMKNQNFI